MVATSPSMRSHSWSEVYSVVMKFPLARLAFVSIGNERRGGDLQRQPLPAHFGEDRGADRSERRGDVAHRDRRIEARAETARCHPAHLFGGGAVRQQPRALAPPRAGFGPPADAAA